MSDRRANLICELDFPIGNDIQSLTKPNIAYVESAVTAVLFLEILIRIAVDYRNFWSQKTNLADLVIAVITVIIQLPGIRSHGQTYAWLTFFQIIRIYRVVLAVPITRNLIVSQVSAYPPRKIY